LIRPQRCGGYPRSRPSWPATPPSGRSATGGPTPHYWHAACRDCPPWAAPRSPPSSATRTGFPSAAHLKSYQGLTPRASETGNTDRKGQPMSKAGSRLARVTLIRARRPGPANKTPNRPGSTTSRWSNAAPSTSKPPASWRPGWPNGSGPSCTAACPTSSATPTAPRSLRSPRNNPKDHRGAAVDRPRRGPPPAAQHKTKAGKALTKSTRDMIKTLEA